MYTGTLIDDLMATVDRTEERTGAQATSREERDGYFFMPGSSVLEMAQREPNLMGVA